MNQLKFQMAKYQEKINQLCMLRADLDEQTIVDAVQKIASKCSASTIDVLANSIDTVMNGETLQWGKDA